MTLVETLCNSCWFGEAPRLSVIGCPCCRADHHAGHGYEEVDGFDDDPDPCNHCPHDNADHAGDGCLRCPCDVPQ
jgi:hypothetical protein